MDSLKMSGPTCGLRTDADTPIGVCPQMSAPQSPPEGGHERTLCGHVHCVRNVRNVHHASGPRLLLAGSRPGRPERSRGARIEQIRCALTTPRRNARHEAPQGRQAPVSPEGTAGGLSRNLPRMGAATDSGLMRRFFFAGTIFHFID
jgi:hypothetical protein